MTLSTLRLGNGWNKARMGSNRFTAQKSDACPKSLDVRFIRVASHAKDVIKHVWTRALMCPGRFASVHACRCVIAFSGRTSCYWWLDIVLREFGRIAGSQAAHRLRLQTVQARRPGLVRKCLHSLDFSFAESFKQSGGCVRKNQHPMVRFFGLYSIELNKIAIYLHAETIPGECNGRPYRPNTSSSLFAPSPRTPWSRRLDARCWSRFRQPRASQLWGLLRQALAGWRVWRFPPQDIRFNDHRTC